MRTFLFVLVLPMTIIIMGLLGSGQTEQALVAKYVDVPVPIKLNDPIWQQASPLTIKLTPQQIVAPWGGGSVPHIEVRALHNGQFISFLLSWPDATVNQELVANDHFSDGVAVQFPTDVTAIPTPFMGDAKNAVNIWQWQAAWQRDVNEGGIADVDRTHTAYGDIYVEELMREKGEIFWRPGEFVNNWRAQRTRVTPVENLVALGFGTLTHLVQQDVYGDGKWNTGQWQVTVGRALHTHLSGETEFKPGAKTKINVAVWEGSVQDRGGRKSVSMQWHPLELQDVTTITTGTVSQPTEKTNPPTTLPEPTIPQKAPASIPPIVPAILAGLGGLIVGALIAILVMKGLSARG